MFRGVLAGRMVQGVLLRMNQDTRAFTLVANWGNSPEQHNYQIHSICIHYHTILIIFLSEKKKP